MPEIQDAAQRYAVVIGIDDYQDAAIQNLSFASADATALYNVLTDPNLGRFSPYNVKLLLNDDATHRAIRSAIATWLANQSRKDDTVIIYYAGHGAPVINARTTSKDGMEKYLVPHDAEMEDLRATGIAMDEVQRWFGFLESKRVLFLIDSCYSGVAGGRTFQRPGVQARATLTGEFLDELSGEGRMVVTACDVNEVSLETASLGHGVFTHFLVEGLKGAADQDQDGLVGVDELYQYVYSNVDKFSRSVGGRMTPVRKGEARGEFSVTQYETEHQREAKALSAEADRAFESGLFDEAHQLWLTALKFDNSYEDAIWGIALIEHKQRKTEAKLRQRQKTLEEFEVSGDLTVAQYDRAMSLLSNQTDDLTADDKQYRRRVVQLADRDIAMSTYLTSVTISAGDLDQRLEREAQEEPSAEADSKREAEEKERSKRTQGGSDGESSAGSHLLELNLGAHLSSWAIPEWIRERMRPGLISACVFAVGTALGLYVLGRNQEITARDLAYVTASVFGLGIIGFVTGVLSGYSGRIILASACGVLVVGGAVFIDAAGSNPEARWPAGISMGLIWGPIPGALIGIIFQWVYRRIVARASAEEARPARYSKRLTPSNFKVRSSLRWGLLFIAITVVSAFSFSIYMSYLSDQVATMPSPLNPGCEGRDADACFELALDYAGGLNGLGEDAGKAMSLYQKACDGGLMVGCYFLGDMYENGEGVTKDSAKAAALYQQACEGGYRNSACMDAD